MVVRRRLWRSWTEINPPVQHMPTLFGSRGILLWFATLFFEVSIICHLITTYQWHRKWKIIEVQRKVWKILKSPMSPCCHGCNYTTRYRMLARTEVWWSQEQHHYLRREPLMRLVRGTMDVTAQHDMGCWRGRRYEVAKGNIITWVGSRDLEVEGMEYDVAMAACCDICGERDGKYLAKPMDLCGHWRICGLRWATRASPPNRHTFHSMRQHVGPKKEWHIKSQNCQKQSNTRRSKLLWEIRAL
jgi:hypothetical protein